MKKCEVLIEFIDRETYRANEVGSIITVSDERFIEINSKREILREISKDETEEVKKVVKRRKKTTETE